VFSAYSELAKMLYKLVIIILDCDMKCFLADFSLCSCQVS